MTPADYQFLVDFVGMNKDLITKRDVWLARDCYDDCIAFLDAQLGRLLDELQGQGLLENTDVIITSDHGEAFGEHLFFGHAYNTNLDADRCPAGDPLPARPAGQVVYSPVSLRDLPATVVDLLGLSAGSPFPGRSLAAYWESGPGKRLRRAHQPRPLRAGRSGRIPNPAANQSPSTRASRCRWWPRAIITSGTAWGSSSSTI